MTLPIPVAALTQHVIALGKTRSGKSSKLRVCAEYLLGKDEALGIIDVKGDWWGIKSSADGKSSGFPLVIFGGEHADVPINAHSGAHVAELVATGNRPYLIDLGGWMVGERTRFFIDFASVLFKLTKGTRYLVIPECHNFAPKGKVFDPEAGKCLHWANRLASEGQGKGLILLADSQRPQKVHNDFLTSCETLIACRVIHKADRDAIKDWVDGCADPVAGKTMLGELAQMQRADAWVWSPEVGFGPERITWPMFKTYDSFKPQPINAGKLKGWASVDLEDVKTKLSKVVEEAKANDPKVLRAEIARLKVELAATPPAVAPRGYSKEHLNEACDRAEREGREKGISDALKASAAQRKALAEAVAAAVAKVFADFKVGPEMARGGMLKPSTKPFVVGADPSEKFVPGKVVNVRFTPFKNDESKPVSVRICSMDTLKPGQAKILAALIQYPDGVTREQLTVLVGYKPTSRNEYLKQLKALGYCEERGERMVATDAGRAALPDAEPLPTGAALRTYWFDRLPPGERALLEVLVEEYPKAVDVDVLGERCGYKATSRNEYLKRLNARNLIARGRGEVSASEVLFA